MRTVFFGTPRFAVPSLRAVRRISTDVLVVTRPDSPAGRGMKPRASAIADEAKTLGIETLKPERLDDAFHATLRRWEPDVAVLSAYGKILKKETLAIPQHGFLNVHPSLLPRHRGATPMQNSLLSGDVETGVSIMKMDEGVDTGPLVSQERLPLSGTETFGDLETTLAEVGAKLLGSCLPRYCSGTVRLSEQDTAHATLTRRLTKEDASIDWTADAIRIERQVRAFSPRPGAWTLFERQPLKILLSHVGTTGNSPPPGTVLRDTKNISVVCGNGTLLVLDKVQPAGKSPMHAGAFANGHPSVFTAVFPSPKTQGTSPA